MQNPFSDFKTNEMSIEKIEEFFTPPRNFDRIYTPNAMFITGQRGSGKTMFMRYVENRPVVEDNRVKYVGVYLRFDRLVYGSSGFCGIDSDLFLHHLIITLIKRLVNRLSELCSRHNMMLRDFSAFAKVVCTTFFDEETECHSFQEIDAFLEKQRFLVMRYIRNPKRVDQPLICDYSSCFARITEQLHREAWFSDVTVLFLLDEYENLNPRQRQAVNGLIKAASYGYTFKVFHRPIRLDTQVLDSDEHLMEQHDIMATDFFNEIIGGEAYYPGFMAQIVQKRLRLYYNAKGISYTEKDLDVNQYLSTITVNDEFAELSKKRNCANKIIDAIKNDVIGFQHIPAANLCSTLSGDIFRLRLFKSMLEKKLGRKGEKGEKEKRKIIDEVINEFKTESKIYKGWVENYKYAILYLLCFENQLKKQTAGWDQILAISNGIARHVINILYYTFEKDSTRENEKYRCFSADEQTNAAYTVAEKLYDDIIRVPVVGKAELSMIQYFGKVFQICHRDSTIKKWEVNHFVINERNLERGGEKEKDQKRDQVEKVLDAAITWGHIIKKKATKAKRQEELSADLSEYHIHPLLAVYFGVSWRCKQRYETTFEEVYDAAYEVSQRQAAFKKAAKRILGSDDGQLSIDLDCVYMQPTLFDFDNSELN